MTTQVMTNAVKLNKPLQYDNTIDYKLIEVWIFGVDNYYKLVRLTDEVQQTGFAAILLIKNAALWLRSAGLCKVLNETLYNYTQPSR